MSWSNHPKKSLSVEEFQSVIFVRHMAKNGPKWKEKREVEMNS